MAKFKITKKILAEVSYLNAMYNDLPISKMDFVKLFQRAIDKDKLISYWKWKPYLPILKPCQKITILEYYNHFKKFAEE